MIRRGVRAGFVLRAFGVGLLVTTLILVLGWAVIGKHRLDPQARTVYKATRLVVARAVAQVSNPDPGLLRPSESLQVTETPRLTPAPSPHRVERPARRSRARSSRAPPSA